MGLLDDLKKQAETVQSQQISKSAMREEMLQQVDEKMKLSFQYLNELLKHLVVLKPVNPVKFSVPGVIDLQNLQYGESFIDSRKSRVANADVYDLIQIYLKWGSPATKVTLDRDMPATAQKVRDALFASGIKFVEDEIMSARSSITGWKFGIESALVTDILIKPDLDQGRLMFRAKNLLRLGIDDFAVPAPEMSEGVLEEFAKTLLGHPSAFQKYRTVSPLR